MFWRWTLFCVIVLSNYVTAGDDDVLDLSNNDLDGFKSELAKYDTVLVEFFAPWCGHCKRLAPEYAKAATALLANDPAVPLAKVDCTTDNGKEICSTHGVSGYPTLKIFKAGEFASEYNGPREADGIVKYMRSQVGPASKSYTSFATLNDKLKAAKEVTIVGIFKGESDSLATKFHKTADKLRESVNFAHIYSSSASDDVAALSVLSKSKVSAPVVVLVRPSALANKFEDSAVVWDESGSLEDWVNTNYHGLVGHRTQSNMQDFKPPLVVVYYDVDYVKNPKGTNYWRNRVLKVAQNYPKVKFAVANSNQFAGEMEEFGLEQDRSGRDAVPVVAARDAEGKKFVQKEKFSIENLEAFVKDFVAGKLEPHLKSEEIPEDNNGPVKVAVGKNFDELVTNSKKDVLVEFYAPWCGHCKKLAPTYEDLGKALAEETSVEIVKMDATANDVPSTFEVHGFPTIYWYPSGTKSPVKYNGGREVNDFIEYIAKHSTEELKTYTRDGKKRKEEL
ncbi:protein disulfide-isomerase A3-like [Panonychus citri]|uniref:protein disulfide-isomerase A3-like n=1 Tax=Panonychus citri TaxID=50023 RepID=UPI002307A32E|nr:protein disulfide-isomerase A3-like [Panonychus citri]